ncbi:MAG: hypothetical protein GX316_05535 [Firmicutes bacterium]|nr:hypothetical protein [Bacillota bacterium]
MWQCVFWGLVILLLTIPFVPWRVAIHYRVGQRSDLNLRITWLGFDMVGTAEQFMHYSRRLVERIFRSWGKIPTTKEINVNSVLEDTDWSQLMASWRVFNRYFGAFVNPLLKSVRNLNWYIKLGFADPALTALTVGSLQGLGAFAEAHLQKKLALAASCLNWAIAPNFEGVNQLDLQLDCILMLNPGYIMVAGSFDLLRSVLRKGVDVVGPRS